MMFNMLKRIAFFCVLFSIPFFNSCSKDNNDDPAPQGSMTAKLDNTDWSASLTGASILNGSMNISGQSASGEILTITITDDQVGTYPLNAVNAPHVAAYSEAPGANAYTSNGADRAGGYVEVTEINEQDSTISGNFEFLTVRTIDDQEINVTEGQFTGIKYTTSIPGTDNYITCLVDGVSFTPPSVLGFVNSGKLILNGVTTDGSRSIGLNMPENISPGEYSLDAFGEYVGIYNFSLSATSTNAFSSDSGKLTITKHDTGGKEIEGTFEFVGVDYSGANSNVNITAGLFRVKY